MQIRQVLYPKYYTNVCPRHFAPLLDHCEESASPDLLELAQQSGVTAPLLFVNINQGLQVPVKCHCPMCFYLTGIHANVTLLPRRALKEYSIHTQHSVLLSTPHTVILPLPALPYLGPLGCITQAEHSVFSTHIKGTLSFHAYCP